LKSLNHNIDNLNGTLPVGVPVPSPKGGSNSGNNITNVITLGSQSGSQVVSPMQSTDIARSLSKRECKALAAGFDSLMRSTHSVGTTQFGSQSVCRSPASNSYSERISDQRFQQVSPTGSTNTFMTAGSFNTITGSAPLTPAGSFNTRSVDGGNNNYQAGSDSNQGVIISAGSVSNQGTGSTGVSNQGSSPGNINSAGSTVSNHGGSSVLAPTSSIISIKRAFSQASAFSNSSSPPGSNRSKAKVTTVLLTGVNVS
jgi:hypothetical protein